MQTSTRYQISHPVLARTDAPDIPLHIKNTVDKIEALGMQYGHGPIGSRPTSTPGSPGIAGRLYIVTSGAETGQLHYDFGTGWLWLNNIPSIGAGSITATELASNAVTQVKMADDSVGAAEIIAGAVGFSEVADALKPSVAAAGSAEALRALGTAAGTAAPGVHGISAHDVGVGGDDFGTTFPTTGLYNGYLFTLFIGSIAWSFMYRADLDATYPWHFLGGPPITATTGNVGIPSFACPIAAPRTGIYTHTVALYAFVNSLDSAAAFWFAKNSVNQFQFGELYFSSTIGMGMGLFAGCGGTLQHSPITVGQNSSIGSAWAGSGTAGSIQSSTSSIIPVKLI